MLLLYTAIRGCFREPIILRFNGGSDLLFTAVLRRKSFRGAPLIFVNYRTLGPLSNQILNLYLRPYDLKGRQGLNQDKAGSPKKGPYYFTSIILNIREDEPRLRRIYSRVCRACEPYSNCRRLRSRLLRPFYYRRYGCRGYY